MRLIAPLLTSVPLLLAFTVPLHGQSRDGVMGDLILDVTEVETKIIALAKAMPVSTYEWRPAPGVRSTGEVLIHVAGDNYFMPVLLGGAAPAETGIDIERRRESVEAFEKRAMTRDQIIAELEKSFRFLKQAMGETPDASLVEQPKFERRKMSTRRFWIATASHLHEHLGQLIAYARSNKVTPPWSQ
jgi:hypothetical protein